MGISDALVEVDPASVERVIQGLRDASRAYSDAAGRLCTNLPLMPPVFFMRTQVELDMIAARLQRLAVELEVSALREAWRIAWLIDAGAGAVAGATGDFINDLAAEARGRIVDLDREPGPEATLDPFAARVHFVHGVADNLGQMWQELAMIGRLEPGYGTVDPAGGEEARVAAVNTVYNLVDLSGAWDWVDPGTRLRALQHAVGRAIDWNDIAAGDAPRWLGHVGSGIVLGAFVSGLAGGSKGAFVTTEADEGLTLGAAYKGFNNANKIPSDASDDGKPSTRAILARLERKVRPRSQRATPARQPVH
jgi:hypothetical protein